MSSRTLNRSIGNRIKTVRLKNSLTQQAFASSVGIAQSYLSELEKGIKKPSDTLLIALAYRHEINMGWLLTGKGEMSGISVKQPLKLDFMREIIESVENVFEEQKTKLPPNKKAELVILLYEKLLNEESQFKGTQREKFLRDNVIKFIRLAS